MNEISLFIIWLVGAFASNAAQRVMGEANPKTIGDSLTGDDTVDIVCVIAWPVFWPCWLVHWITKTLTEMLTDD